VNSTSDRPDTLRGAQISPNFDAVSSAAQIDAKAADVEDAIRSFEDSRSVSLDALRVEFCV
jgi:hypothetical protein